MIEVKPIQTKSEQEALCALCSVKYKADDFAYSAKENSEFVGICQFSIESRGGVIHDIKCIDGKDDFDSLFIMGRATLNFIDLCGVHTAFFEQSEDLPVNERLVKAIGFKKNILGKYEMDLTNFFEHPCSHTN